MTATDIFHHAHVGAGELMLEDDSVAATLPNAVQNKVEDWLALELTAEDMAKDELFLVGTYIASTPIANDTRSFLQDIKGGLLAWELNACDFILSAADPTQLEWQRAHWWDSNNVDATTHR
jgi:hypothetical protein